MIEIAILICGTLLALLYLLAYPAIGAYLLIFFSIFDFGYFSRWLNFSRHFSRIPYFIATLMLVVITLNFLMKKRGFTQTDKGVKICFQFIVSIFLLGILSLFYSSENIVLGLYELRYYLLFFVTLVSIYFFFPYTVTQEIFIKICVFICLLQIPATILQYSLVQFYGLRVTISTLDMSSGTFSGYSALLAIVCITLAFILIYQFNNQKRLLGRINNNVLCLIILTPLLFSNSRSAIGFVVILYLFIIVQFSFQVNPAVFLKKALLLVFLMTVAITLFYYIFWLPKFDIKEQLNPQYIKEYFFREAKTIQSSPEGVRGVMGRARSIVESYNLISDNLINLLLGMGSSAVSDASFLNKKGSYYEYYGLLAGIDRTQVSKIMSELGLLGIAFYFGFFYKIFRYILLDTNKRFTPVILKYTLTLLFIIILLSFYSRIFHEPIVFLILSLFFCMIRDQGVSEKKLLYNKES